MKHDHRQFSGARAYAEPTAALIARFTPMVRRMAWHLHGSAGPEIEPEDLMQAGFIALTECARRHCGPDIDGFAAYAKIRVRGAMIDVLRKSAPLSRGAMRQRRRLRETAERLRGQMGREPDTAELATALGLAPSQVLALQMASGQVRVESLDECYSENDLSFRDTAPDQFTILAELEHRESLIAAISALPERLRTVIQLYFVEELNLAEIAAVLGVSVPRIHQLKDQALQGLRAALGGSCGGGNDPVSAL